MVGRPAANVSFLANQRPTELRKSDTKTERPSPRLLRDWSASSVASGWKQISPSLPNRPLSMASRTLTEKKTKKKRKKKTKKNQRRHRLVLSLAAFLSCSFLLLFFCFLFLCLFFLDDRETWRGAPIDCVGLGFRVRGIGQMDGPTPALERRGLVRQMTHKKRRNQPNDRKMGRKRARKKARKGSDKKNGRKITSKVTRRHTMETQRNYGHQSL